MRIQTKTIYALIFIIVFIGAIYFVCADKNSKTTKTSNYNFRSTPKSISLSELKTIFKKYDFYFLDIEFPDSSLNEFKGKGKGINNEFELQSLGSVVFDKTTGLYWERDGSTTTIQFDHVNDYIENLNAKQFGGYSDWRLPTIEEALSLIIPLKNEVNEFHIDSIFGHKKWIWTSDRIEKFGVWIIDYSTATCGVGLSNKDKGFIRAVRYGKSHSQDIILDKNFHFNYHYTRGIGYAINNSFIFSKNELNNALKYDEFSDACLIGLRIISDFEHKRIEDQIAVHLFRSFAENNKEAKISEVNKALKLDNNYYMSYIRLGYYYNTYFSQHLNALENYKISISLNPKCEYAYLNRGYVYAELENNEKAIEDFNKSIEINPNLIEAYYNLGLIYGILGDSHKAIYNYTKYLDRKPTDPDLYFLRGDIYFRTGDDKKARNDWEKFIELSKNGTRFEGLIPQIKQKLNSIN